MVPFGFKIACRLASWPTSRSPCGVKATTDGVVRDPSAFGITVGLPCSVAAMTELVVPRSIPTAIAIFFLLQSSGRKVSRLGCCPPGRHQRTGSTSACGPLNLTLPCPLQRRILQTGSPRETGDHDGRAADAEDCPPELSGLRMCRAVHPGSLKEAL